MLKEIRIVQMAGVSTYIICAHTISPTLHVVHCTVYFAHSDIHKKGADCKGEDCMILQ